MSGRPLLSILLPRREMRAPVLLPAGFVRFVAHGALLAVADGFQTVGWNTELHQEVLGGTRPAIAQTKVVFQRHFGRGPPPEHRAERARLAAGAVGARAPSRDAVTQPGTVSM